MWWAKHATVSPHSSSATSTMMSWAPPGFRKEFTGAADQEAALFAHIRQHEQASCQATEPQGAACDAPTMSIAIPEFVPVTASKIAAVGCAKLRDGDAHAKRDAPIQIPLLRFEANSATLSTEGATAADALVARLEAAPRIECIALGGQVALGESLDLASSRASAAKAELIRRGADASRITIFDGAEAPYLSVAREEREALDEHRSVRITVAVFLNDDAAETPPT